MRVRLSALVLVCAFFASESATAQQPVAVPPELEPWRAWVLHDQQHLSCPFLSTANPASPDSARCVWPERLALDLGASGGTFSQRWQVYAESWVPLPGSLEHWPREVRVNGTPGAVVARSGAPFVRLPAGTHVIAGRLAWTNRPESLPVAPESALVELRLDGRLISQPERPDGAVWLGKRRSAEQREEMQLQVYRLVEDTIPVSLVTHVRAQVAGDAREIVIGPVLPAGFVPVALDSGLAARLEPDGRLRVQVRAGSWVIALTARGPNVASKIARPAADHAWPREEVWSFAGEDRLRVAAVEGSESIDPEQADVPGDWQEYPAFRMPPGGTLTVVERSRGLANADDNRLALSRRLWLDFDHGGFTAVDRITGTMRRDWRLDALPPFRLESARTEEATLLVTRSGEDGRAGVEVRNPTLDLIATSRIDRARGAMPATGWDVRFEGASGQLHLPPGHRLLAVFGADQAPTSWIERWGLWGFFGVLVVAVFAGWFAGPVVGAIALLGLLLTYQEGAGYIWLWGNLLAAAALARAAPEGRLRRVAGAYRTVSAIVLGVALLPFLWGQMRVALYPQLEAAAYAGALETDVVGAPAAAPELARQEMADELSSVIVTGSRVQTKSYSLERYAPGTVLQAGPGVPSWHYHVHPYRWSGPLEPRETVRFVYIGPILLGLWRIAGVVLLVALLAALVTSSFGLGRPGGQRFARAGARSSARPASSVGAALIATALVAMICASPVAHAEATPDAAVLNELRQRLMQPPKCHPSCFDVMAARVTANPDRIDVVLDVSALANVAVPVPAASDRWQLDTVTVNGRGAPGIVRDGDGASFRIPLERGSHVVRLSGRVVPSESIQLAFPAPPRVITVASDGWDVAGVNADRLVSGSLELIRQRAGGEGASDLRSAEEFPPFVRVVRDVALGLDWSIDTSVQRIAPETAAFTIGVPLLAGESVLTEDIEVRDLPGGRVALVGLERGEHALSWNSTLSRGETLVLELAENTPRTEVWRFRAGPEWNVRFEGFAAVLPEELDASQWVYEFHPRPGEKLRLEVSRPAPAPGRTLAIDSVAHRVVLGKRSSDETLAFNYRSTQGGRHTIVLPTTARVTSVTVDDEPVQLRPDEGRLSIGMLPGEHKVALSWTLPEGVSARVQPVAVDLGTPASNVRTTLELPRDRWALLTSGPGVGPAVLYWTELAAFLATAWLLGRWSWSPLRTHEWLLLGIGLSTFAWGVFALAALWLFAMRWRETWEGKAPSGIFNLVQVVLAGLTVIAVGTLVFSGIRESLLGVPDMGVAGPGSGSNTFMWFVDQTESALPGPTVLSVPMWVYRALMFAWALWIVLALLRWLRWAWRAWRTGGIWKSKVIAQPDGRSAGG